MKDISTSMQSMLDKGRFSDPGCRIVCDIDPPFVGADLNQTGSYPSLCLHNGTLYLTFVDDNYIKVVTVDHDSKAITGTYRSISAANAINPRLIFETTIYPDYDDLPHLVYINSATNQLMAYRETYNTLDMSIATSIIQVAIGQSIDIVLAIDGFYYYFYTTNDGKLYSKKQGESAQILITPDTGETIFDIRAFNLPTKRVGFIFGIKKEDSCKIVRAYSEYIIVKDAGIETVNISPGVTNFDFKKIIFDNPESMTFDTSHKFFIVYTLFEPNDEIEPISTINLAFLFTDNSSDESLLSSASLEAIEFVQSGYHEYVAFTTSTNVSILFSINNGNESVQMNSTLSSLTYAYTASTSNESINPFSTVQLFEFFTD